MPATLSEAGRAITAIKESFTNRLDTSAPHLHVSAPITDKRLLNPTIPPESFLYTRTGNHPDQITLESWAAEFEGGARFRVRADGMNALTIALFAAKDEMRRSHFVFVRPLYGGTEKLAKDLEELLPGHFSFTYLSAFSPNFIKDFIEALREDTAAILCEFPGNPTYPLADIENMRLILDTLYKYKYSLRPILIADNTTSVAVFCPFRWGADVMGRSDTKCVEGESAWSMGSTGVSERFLKEHPRFWEKVAKWCANFGGTPGPIETHITAEFSVKDILSRVAKHSENALAVAQFLEGRAEVERVIYPGLPSYPWRRLAEKYFEPIGGKRVYGSMLAFYLRGADLEKTYDFLLHLYRSSEIPFMASFGGPHTMTASPMLLTHRGMSAEAYASCGITPNLIRISAGREDDPREIIEPLTRSLDAFHAGTIPSYP